MQLVLREEAFKDKVKPLLDQVKDLCKSHDIPFLVAFRVDERDDDSKAELYAGGSCPCSEHGYSMEMFMAQQILTHGDACKFFAVPVDELKKAIEDKTASKHSPDPSAN